MIDSYVRVSITPTVTEIADEIWEMSADDQITMLSCLDTRFFQIPADGERQLAEMFMTLRKQSPKKQEAVRHFVKALHQYLVEEDNSEIEEA